MPPEDCEYLIRHHKFVINGHEEKDSKGKDSFTKEYFTKGEFIPQTAWCRGESFEYENETYYSHLLKVKWLKFNIESIK